MIWISCSRVLAFNHRVVLRIEWRLLIIFCSIVMYVFLIFDICDVWNPFKNALRNLFTRQSTMSLQCCSWLMETCLLYFLWYCQFMNLGGICFVWFAVPLQVWSKSLESARIRVQTKAKLHKTVDLILESQGVCVENFSLLCTLSVLLSIHSSFSRSPPSNCT